MSQVRPLLSPLLVGRDDLLELGGRRVDEAAAERGGFLLLAGEAGIGKSRLMDAVRRRSERSGFRYSAGFLAPQDRFVPRSLILDLARSLRRQPEFGPLGDDILATHAAGGGDELAARRILVLDLVDRIASAFDRPTVLAFEDLQWADELSLEVLSELARAVRDRPVLLLGAYRTDELPVGSILREWRARLVNQRLVEEARLSPLTFEQTALMTSLILATGLPAPREVVNAVYDRTDGIPLHIEELLGALGEDARRDGRAIRDAQVPDTIEDAILARIGRLSEDARAVARAGAVIGRSFVPEVLAGIMDRPVAELDDPLAELVAQSVLEPPGARGEYDYRHQLLRDALYRTVPAVELRRLHARAGEFCAQLEGASEIHASVHFERAGLRAQAFRAALAGARAAAAVSGRGESFELYRRAVANIPDDLPVAELADLYDAFGDAAEAVDEVTVATDAARMARRLYLEAGRPVGAALQLAAIANIARRNVRPLAERSGLLAEAMAELEALPQTRDRELARCEVLLLRAINERDAMELDAADATAAEARLLADDRTEDASVLDIDTVTAEVEVLRGHIGAGLAASLRVARAARDAGLESTGVTGYRQAAAVAVRVMDYDLAALGLREGLRYADEIEQSYCRHVMAAASAMVAWAAGRWDEALGVAELELVERGSRRGALGSRDALGYVAFGRGDVDRARTLLEDSLAAGRESGEIALVLPALWGLAETDLVAKSPAAAARRCEAALELAVEAGERPLLVPFVVTGTRAQLEARRPDAAGRWLEGCAEQLAGWEALSRPALDHAEGLVRLAAGMTVTAREALEAAVGGWDGRGRTWEAAWARLDLAACHVRGGRHAAALPLLAEVEAVAERLAGAPLLDRVQELGRTVRSRGVDEEPWHPLTAREYEIARLVSEGQTNGEIAAALGLSPKTVSAHVEHILAKLGAARRAEIAVWAAAVSRPPAGVTEVAARR